jgi:hypothetical protein
MTIHRLAIHNFMGISARQFDFPASGAVIEGANGKGKTSVLKAVRAALASQGCEPSAIRNGADAAEILVDLDDVSVRRLITQTGGNLTVTDANGARIKAPQTFLADLLGLAPLDPIGLFLEPDAKKRRKTVLAALPCTVTTALLARWVPAGTDLGAVLGRDAAGAPNVAGHGLEVVERLRSSFYGQRTDANRAAENASKDAAAAAAALAAAETTAATFAAAAAFADVERALTSARADVAALRERARAAAAAEAASSRTRLRVADLRAQAQAQRDNATLAPTPDEIADAEEQVRAKSADVATATDIVADLTHRLEVARSNLAAATAAAQRAVAAFDVLADRHAAADRDAQRAADLAAQADELAAAVGDRTDGVTPEQIATAEALVAKYEQDARAASAKQSAEARLAEARAAVEAASKKSHDAAARAASLDATVRTLTHDAPAALLAAANAVPGLGIDGDTITLDGVALDRLCGAEQLRFATDIARRLNAKSKLLVVDGLERLDGVQRAEFIKHATADGFQLIATRVTDTGDADVSPIAQATEAT